jgi:dTDP-4-dehydrorhamnose 3,5-epimerase
MKVTETKIADVKVIEPTVFQDERGFFFESFNHKKFEEAIGHNVTFVQDNHSDLLPINYYSLKLE